MAGVCAACGTPTPGDMAECPRCGESNQRTSALSHAAPLTSQGQFVLPDNVAGALARVKLLVACDSGPVHLATAVGTPALALFGPTSTVRWGPPAPGRALALGLACAPCSNHGGDTCPHGHHRCLADLSADAVVTAAREMLAV